jgi:hypothetical protein
MSPSMLSVSEESQYCVEEDMEKRTGAGHVQSGRFGDVMVEGPVQFIYSGKMYEKLK